MESIPGEKTIFKIYLPVDKDVYPADQVKSPATSSKILPSKQMDALPLDTLPSILIVEDNNDLRSFLKKTLEQEYQIMEAKDGNEAWQLMTKTVPNLVLSDILMPYLDGISLCKKIKETVLTSHVPVILLTGRTANSQKRKGLEMGADDYLTKPFRSEFLKIRVRNLIKSREQLKKRFSLDLDFSTKELTPSTSDYSFLKKAICIVEKHLDDPDFDVKVLVHEMGMSRSVFYVKLPSLTDLSPNEFIRVIRLKKAAKMLKKNNLTIAEVSYSVGFSTPKYFSKIFRDHFGLSPSEYAKSLKKSM